MFVETARQFPAAETSEFYFVPSSVRNPSALSSASFEGRTQHVRVMQ